MSTREDATNTTNTTNTPKTGPRNPRKLFTDVPPFVHDRPILIGKRPRPPLKFGGNYKLEGAESGSENSTSQQDAQSPPADDGSFSPSPVAKSTTIAETTNWLNTRNRRTMRLEEAWNRTDENNGFRPRTAPGIARTNSAQGQSTTEGKPQAGAFSRARTSQGHLRTTSSGPERVVREGRIGRANTYSASPKGAQPFLSSPPTTLAKAYARAEKEEQQTPASRESESETSSVVGAGSPSPAARDKPRWNTDYESKVSTKKSVEELTGDEVKTHIRQVSKSQESPKIQEDRPRPLARTESHRERIMKPLEAKPIFTKKRAPLDVDRPFAGRKSKAELTPKPAETTREFDTGVDFTSNSLQVSESPMLKIRQQEPSPPIVSPDIGQSPIPEGIIIEKYPLPKDYIPPSSSSKEDSLETLKKLSRLLSPKTSRPPTPEEKEKKETENDPEERIAAEAKLFEAQDKSERNSIHVPSRSRSPSPSPAPAASAVVIPSHVPANSPPLAPAPAEDEKIDETPRPTKIDPLSLPTPKVTGAYIETPAASVRRPGKQRSDSPKPASDIYESDDDLASLDNIRRIRSSSSQRSSASRGSSSDRTALEKRYQSQHRSSRRGSEDSHASRSTSSRRASDDDQITKDTSSQRDAIPIEQTQNLPRPLINTAKLNSAAEDVRLLQIQAGLEDTTLDDFDAIIENESIAIPTTDATASDPIDYLTYDEDGELLTKRERERRLELLFLERMSTRLRNTSSNIRQAKQGIERLESQVSATPVLTPTSADPVSETISEPPVIHIDIKLQLPQIWTHSEPAAPEGRNGAFWNRNWRFTWIGLILFIVAAWYISELAMCSVFCKPQYASTATWKYSDPLFPWAIPTKTGQWMKAVSRWIMGGLDRSENVSLQAGTFSEDEFL